MLLARSIAFNVYFYLNITLWLIAMLPLMLLPGSVMWWVVATWSRVNLWALRVIAGISVEVRGREHLAQSPVIIASKHQSAWETVTLLDLYRRPAFIIKKELMWVPLFGWYASRCGMIAVDRGKGQTALRSMIDNARKVVAGNRQIVIYPEGTRRPVGAAPNYKFGIGHLYRELNIPCIPVALNSGLYWPRRGFWRYPGRVIIEFLPPIPAGLDRDEFFQRLQHEIETASDRLLLEAARSVAPPPLSSETMERIALITKT